MVNQNEKAILKVCVKNNRESKQGRPLMLWDDV